MTHAAERHFKILLLLLLLLLAPAACQRSMPDQAESQVASGSVAGADAPEVAGKAVPGDEAGMLAYEHSVDIQLPAGEIPSRVDTLQSACHARRFGACVVLNVQRNGGDHPSASLTLRIAPAGVEPMIGLAGAGGELGNRSTRAEDLAVVVRDNTLVRQRLRHEFERLAGFQQRRDLAVSDMIALSKQIAETQAQLELAEQEAAQHRRRIDTQLLNISLQPPRGQVGRSEIAQAFRDFGRTLSTGAAWTIRALAFLIPLALLLAGLFVLVRHLRHRR